MSYEELKKVLRTGYPGLEVTTDQVTDNQIRGLWRGLDDDLSGEVSVQEFMIFFRRHGREHSMFKPTDHDLASRAVRKSKFYGATPARWRGGAGSSPLDASDSLVDFHTGREVCSKDQRKWRKYNSHRRN